MTGISEFNCIWPPLPCGCSVRKCESAVGFLLGGRCVGWWATLHLWIQVHCSWLDVCCSWWPYGCSSSVSCGWTSEVTIVVLKQRDGINFQHCWQNQLWWRFGSTDLICSIVSTILQIWNLECPSEWVSLGTGYDDETFASDASWSSNFRTLPCFFFDGSFKHRGCDGTWLWKYCICCFWRCSISSLAGYYIVTIKFLNFFLVWVQFILKTYETKRRGPEEKKVN